MNSTTTVDGFALVLRSMTTDRTGIITCHNEARVSRDAAGTITIGIGPLHTAMSQIDSVIGTATTPEAAARIYCEAFPANVASLVGAEVSRLRFKAECAARDIKLAAAELVKSNRRTADLNAAMAAAGCTCKVLWEHVSDSTNSYGDYDGMVVYSDSEAGAKRAAAWLIKWEERDYAARGGRYGGSYGQAQHAYSVRTANAPAGAPFAAFACFRYYSRGD